MSYVGQDGLSNDQARVMFPNGDKATINLKNTYFTQQNGDKGTAIVPGQFYEYSKSGSTYEPVSYTHLDVYKRQCLHIMDRACAEGFAKRPARML